jgi:hypothetical protein
MASIETPLHAQTSHPQNHSHLRRDNRQHLTRCHILHPHTPLPLFPPDAVIHDNGSGTGEGKPSNTLSGENTPNRLKGMSDWRPYSLQ